MESGEYKQLNAVEEIAKVLHARGKIASPEVTQLTEADIGPHTRPLSFYLGYLGTNSRARGDRSRQLGWNPSQTTEEFYESLSGDVDYLLKTEGSG